MLTNTRTTMIALVALFSFAGASLVPAFAQAAPNNSAKHEHMCKGYEEEFNAYEDEAFDPELSAAERTQARSNARKTAKAAISSGCDTSSWREQRPSQGTPTEGLRPEGEPKNAPESGSLPPSRPVPPPTAGTLG
jgi:hypothetical protein